MFPREGFNIDTALEIPGLGGGTPDVLGHLKYARGIRIIAIGVTLTGTANLQIYFDSTKADPQSLFFGVGDFDKNGLLIAHVRGTRFRNLNQDCGWQLNPGGGTASLAANGGVYIELLDYTP